ncbi:MAG TPA: T9SS type A sorting domain-containing protein, partial [Candidatus Kapabacteria bacterium]|nr:T9SS type A sorting domain-containing protein [Candidatus Kapabacteria bacterium]
ASTSNFPIAVGGATSATAVSAQPSAQLNGATISSLILFPTADDLLHGFVGNTGKEYPGFPLSIGSRIDATPAITQSQFVIATPDKYLYSYDLAFATGAGWTQYLHDAQHTSYNGASTTPTASAGEFFPKNRVYNWPNPVRDKFTHIRFFVSKNATMHIRIVNLANELVESLPDYQATGGIDNEVELHTDGIQSGVYIVRVEADASDQKDVAFIKMAIVN